ncbi:MAG: thiol-disulfide oxidoreductase DCC family protein [Vicinamibacterales bacterium]
MPLIVFDGVCGLCNGWVDFLLRHDRAGVFRFTPFQSEDGQRVLAEHGLLAGESVVLVVGGRAWRDSSAILEILRRLGGMWSLAYVGVIIPRALRDTLYQFVARRRYRWFGRRQACRIPTPQERKRFL